MKRKFVIVFAALACVLALAGCRTLTKSSFEMDDISKTQKIVAADASGTEKAVLDSEAEIEAFMEAVNAEGWKFAELPEGLEAKGSFTLWQERTITAAHSEESAELAKICTFIVYDKDYLTIDTGVLDIVFTLEIPESTGTYLRELAA